MTNDLRPMTNDEMIAGYRRSLAICAEIQELMTQCGDEPWRPVVLKADTPEEAIDQMAEAVRGNVKHGTFTPGVHGLGIGDLETEEGWLVACHTGCGPTSEARARLIGIVHHMTPIFLQVMDEVCNRAIAQIEAEGQ